MPLLWKDYVGIRGINQEEYFRSHDIKTYEQLVSRINKGDVVPPPLSEVEQFLVKEEKTVEVSKPPPVEEMSKPSPKKKKVAKTSQKTDISKRASKPRTRRSTRKKTEPKK